MLAVKTIHTELGCYVGDFKDDIWLPIVGFENAILGTTKMNEKFKLQAIPQTVHEPPKIEDPVGQLIYLGKDTILSFSRKFQVVFLIYYVLKPNYVFKTQFII